ncbi:MAG TPA: hypothetical protein VFN91_13035 [Myxococcaceae bacterium]|nr:hypothetical protein [Myxococcaceae bacterium]
MNTSLVIDNTQRSTRSLGLLFIALGVLALAAFLSFGVRRSLASPEPSAAFPSSGIGVTTEQTVPMHEASAGDDIAPGNAEPVLVGSP